MPTVPINPTGYSDSILGQPPDQNQMLMAAASMRGSDSSSPREPQRPRLPAKSLRGKTHVLTTRNMK